MGEKKLALQGTYGANINAFWWVAVEIWTFGKLLNKTWSQCDGNADADNRGDCNSSPCTSYRWAKKQQQPTHPAPAANTTDPCLTITHSSRMPRHWKLFSTFVQTPSHTAHSHIPTPCKCGHSYQYLISSSSYLDWALVWALTLEFLAVNHILTSGSL